MINKYKAGIINRIWDCIDWQQSPEYQGILFVQKNVKPIEKLTDAEFNYFQCFVKLSIELLFCNTLNETEDNQKWQYLLEGLVNCSQVGQRESSQIFYNLRRSCDFEIKKTISWLPEYYRFSKLYQQVAVRQEFLKKDFDQISNRQTNIQDYLEGVDLETKKRNIIKAVKCKNNPLLFSDIFTQTDQDILINQEIISHVCNSFANCSVPLNDSFIKDINIANKELAFQMVLDIIEHFNNRQDRKTRLLGKYLWNNWEQNAPFHTLYQTIYNNIDEYISACGELKFDWKAMRDILLRDNGNNQLCINSDIVIIEDNNVKDFIRIPDIKWKQFEFNNNSTLYGCLAKLYEKLYDKNCFETPCKEAFIYRLSGLNRPDDLKIKWIGVKAFLGKIIRCLYEDTRQKMVPQYNDLAKFMGLNANLGGATQIKKGAKDTDEIVNLLTDCGFVNVDVFKEPNIKKVEKFVS